MPRYFFNVYDDVVAIDDEGVELPSLEAAKLQALAGARELIGEQVKHGYVERSHWIDICDEQGSTLHTLRFSDAIEIRD